VANGRIRKSFKTDGRLPRRPARSKRGSRPYLSPAVPGAPAGALVIRDTVDVPDNTYSVGIGMSGVGNHAMVARPAMSYQFTAGPTEYWVGATDSALPVGTVLDIPALITTADAGFLPNVFSRTGTLDKDLAWTFVNG
jgi:hypothetical protein